MYSGLAVQADVVRLSVVFVGCCVKNSGVIVTELLTGGVVVGHVLFAVVESVLLFHSITMHALYRLDNILFYDRPEVTGRLRRYRPISIRSRQSDIIIQLLYLVRTRYYGDQTTWHLVRTRNYIGPISPGRDKNIVHVPAIRLRNIVSASIVSSDGKQHCKASLLRRDRSCRVRLLIRTQSDFLSWNAYH